MTDPHAPGTPSRRLKGLWLAREFPHPLDTGDRIYTTREDARADVFNYIERFYNPNRRHNTAGGLSPVEFERRQSQRLKSV